MSSVNEWGGDSMQRNTRSQENFPLLDAAQFIAAMFVILIHSGRLAEAEPVHFVLKSMLCRIAVPLFLVSTGFFYRKRTKQDSTYRKSYFKRNLSAYLFWSAIYLPYGIYVLCSMKMPVLLDIVALPAGIGYLGTCYHLWYFPAMFFGLFLTEKMLKYFSYPKVFALAFSLFCFGACETYSGYLTHSRLGVFYEVYHHTFFTTRNGLFFSFMFILLGFFLSDMRERSFFRQHLPAKIFFSVLFLCLEGKIIYTNQGDDKNFLFSMIPLSVLLVAFFLDSKKWKDKNFHVLRRFSRYLFLVHPMVLEGIKLLCRWSGLAQIQGIPLFLSTFLCTFSVVGCLFLDGKTRDVPQIIRK